MLEVRYRLRSFANTRLKSPGETKGSSGTVEAGAIGGAGCTGVGCASLSRPFRVKARRCSTSRHPEHLNVRRSKPGTSMGSWTTFTKIISAPQAIQRIAPTLVTDNNQSVRIVRDIS
jgi:hypothetical protein